MIDKPKEIGLSSFFMAKRFVVKEMVKYQNPYPYIAGLLLRTSGKIGNVHLKQRERATGKSGYNFKKLLKLWINGFTAFSIKPLRVGSALGFISSVCGVLLGIISLIRKLIIPTIQVGYTSQMAVTLFLGGLILGVLGIIGEYTGRIYMCINNQPQYVIESIVKTEKTCCKKGCRFKGRSERMMKRVMVIAGGTWQVPLIKKVKSLGYEVVNSNLYEDSIGFKYADFTGVMDVRDKEKNLALAKEYKIDAVLTDQSDIAVPTVAYVAEQMGCPGIGHEMAELFTNKFKMREYCRENKFKYPEYRLCTNVEEAIEFYRELGKKVIIKPLDSQSSRGIFTIESEQELRDRFAETEAFTNSGDYVLVERYIEGTEFTVDGIVIDGTHHTLAISQKEHYSYNRNIASKLFFTNYNETFDYNLLRKTNDELISGTGIKYAITHSEYKFEDGDYYLIEMAARGGGSRIASDIVPFMSGVDNYQLLINAALGKTPSVEELHISDAEKMKERAAVLEFLDIESEGKKITKIEGVEQINAIPEILQLQLEFKEGDIIEKAQDDRSRVGFFIARAESKERIEEIEKEVKNTLKVSFES